MEVYKDIVVHNKEYRVYLIESTNNIKAKRAYADLESTLTVNYGVVQIENCIIIRSNLVCNNDTRLEDANILYSDIESYKRCSSVILGANNFKGDIIEQCTISNSKIIGNIEITNDSLVVDSIMLGNCDNRIEIYDSIISNSILKPDTYFWI